MELEKIIRARKVICALSTHENISTRLAYRFAKFLVCTQGEYEFYIKESEKRIKKYLADDGDGRLLIPSEKVPLFNDEMGQLNQTEVDPPNVKFRLSELATELKINIEEAMYLFDFIQED